MQLNLNSGLRLYSATESELSINSFTDEYFSSNKNLIKAVYDMRGNFSYERDICYGWLVLEFSCASLTKS